MSTQRVFRNVLARRTRARICTGAPRAARSRMALCAFAAFAAFATFATFARFATFATFVVALACSSCKDGSVAKPPALTAGDLEAMKAESARIMPKTFADVWIGMPEKELMVARLEAAPQPHRTDPLERRWFMETSQTGVRVWYGVDRETSRLSVVQFAHQFVSWNEFRAHAFALQNRFGTDYELYQCPTGNEPPDPKNKAAMTRLLWPRKNVSVMEAVLELGGSISVTMIVASPDDCRLGIEKQMCTRVDREEALETWIDQMVQKESEQQDKLDSGEAGTGGKGYTGPFGPPPAGVAPPSGPPPSLSPPPLGSVPAPAPAPAPSTSAPAVKVPAKDQPG